MNKYLLELKEKAIYDIQDAYNWYEQKSTELGERLLDNIEEQIHFISKNRNAFQKTYEKLKQAPIKIFPYVILYLLENNKIYIIAVFNTHQSPNKKRL